MKSTRKLMQHLLFVLTGLAWSATVCAYDFQAENADGVTIYNALDGNDVYVTSEGEMDTSEENTAYALWCEDNATLYFVSSDQPFTIGEQYNGHLISSIWSGNDIISTGRDIPAWNESLRNKAAHIVFDLSFQSQTPTSNYAWFAFFEGLKDIQGLEHLNTSKTTDMQAMFVECSSLTTLNLSMLDTHSVETMKAMFYGCTKLESLNLSGFNTKEVTNMSNMFDKCHSLTSLDLSSFVTSRVEIMQSMFYECRSLQAINLANFDTSNVTNMAWMFYGCSSLKSLDLSHFDTSKVTVMRTMFCGCESLENVNLSNWNTSNVESLRSFFMDCKALKELDLSHFSTERNTSMTYMFSGCTNLETVNLTSFDMKNVEECDSVFDHCSSLRDIRFGVVDLEKAEGIRHMFCSCNSLQEINLCSFKTKNVKYMDGMFNACNELRTIYVGADWSIKSVLSSRSMFNNCYNLIGANGTTYDSRHTDAAYARVDEEGVPGYFTTISSQGISSIQLNQSIDDNNWFTIGGSRLDNKPTRTGLYLHNGQKVIIK